MMTASVEDLFWPLDGKLTTDNPAGIHATRNLEACECRNEEAHIGCCCNSIWLSRMGESVKNQPQTPRRTLLWK
jgi:hypothetical protein